LFLSEVPVIVVFTKFDCIIDEAFQDLEAKSKSSEEAVDRAQEHAKAMFEAKPHMKAINNSRYRPKRYVFMYGEFFVLKEGSSCLP
jgi:GTPase